MSDEVKVKFAKDQGESNRWGLGKFIYRQEGPKKSLNGKVVAGLFGSLMIAGMGYSLLSEISKPTPSQNRNPIGFNESVSSQPPIQVPSGNSELNKPEVPRPMAQKPKIYGGLQLIERPNLGKIPPGTIVKAKFITGASNGPLKAKLLKAVIVAGEELVPDSTTLIGNGSSSDDRLRIQFSKMVYTDGKSHTIHAQACDVSDQIVGVKGEKISKYASLMAIGAGLNFLGGVAEGLQETQIQNGVPVKKSDLRNAALNGTSKAALDQSSQVLEDMKNQKSIIQVDAGVEFYVLFEGE